MSDLKVGFRVITARVLCPRNAGRMTGIRTHYGEGAMIDSASRYGIYSVSDSEGHNVGISSDQYALFQAAEPLGQELLVRRWRAEARRRY